MSTGRLSGDRHSNRVNIAPQHLSVPSGPSTSAAKRTLRARAFQDLAPYLVLALVVVAILTYSLRLWRTGLSAPLDTRPGASYTFLKGDTYTYPYIAKALGEHAFFHNPRVGAPFGLDYHDMYQPDLVHHAALAFLMLFTANPFLAVNLYCLLSYVLIACSAFCVLRRFGLSLPSAFAASILYAFTPAHLFSSEYHLFLSAYFLIPPTILLIVRIFTDLPGSGREFPADSRRGLLRFGLLLSLLVGLAGVYYAFYSALLLGVAALYAFLRRERRQFALVAVACAGTLCLTVLIALLPVYFYHRHHGPNPEAIQRSVLDSHLYSLKIADLLLPSPEHPIKALRRLTATYNQSLSSLNDNESEASALGVLASVGFLFLLFHPFAGRSRSRQGILTALTILALALVLWATVEGFGTLFSFLITPEIRSNTRVIFFLAFLSLAAFGLLADKILDTVLDSGPHSVDRSVLLGAVLLLGLYDQGVSRMKPDIAASHAVFASNDHFVHRIETELPAGAAVLELPYQAFPETAGPNRMLSYDPLAAYLHSSKLRWSYPAMRGRPSAAWIEQLSSLPIPALLPQAVLGGYRGIWVDRFGYANSGDIEKQIAGATGASPTVSEDGRYSFFSLIGYAAALKEKMPGARWDALVLPGKPAFTLQYVAGVYGPEYSGSEQWRWCNQSGAIAILNDTGQPQPVELAGDLRSGFASPSTVEFQLGSAVFKAQASSGAITFHWPLTLAPGLNRIAFRTDAPRVPAPNDPRLMYFRMENMHVLPR